MVSSRAGKGYSFPKVQRAGAAARGASVGPACSPCTFRASSAHGHWDATGWAIVEGYPCAFFSVVSHCHYISLV